MTDRYATSVARGGSDAAAGTILAPWATIAKIKAQAPVGGDQTFLDRGVIWPETFIAPANGVSDTNRIYYGAYGVGPRPLLDGADPVTGFVIDAASVWQKTGVTIDPRQVFEDWTVAGGKRLIKSASRVAMVPSSWFWDSVGFILYVWTTDSADPATHTIAMSQLRLRGIDPNGKSFLAFADWDVTRMGIHAANTAVVGSEYISFDRMEISWDGLVGIRAGNSSYPVGTVSHWVATDVVIHDTVTEGFWGGGGAGNGLVRCEVYNNAKDKLSKGYVPGGGSGSGVLHGTQSVNAFVIDCYIHTSFVGPLLQIEHENHANVTKPIGTVVRGCLLVNDAPFATTGLTIEGIRDSGANSLITKTLVRTTGPAKGPCLSLFSQGGTASGPTNGQYCHLTLYQASTAFSNCVSLTSATNPAFRNIIFFLTGGSGYVYQVSAGYGSGFSSDYNDMVTTGPNLCDFQGTLCANLAAWRATAGQDANSLSADPQFVNPFSGNFRLRATSPCINAGVIIPGVNDVAGSAERYTDLAPDMGYAEYSGDPRVDKVATAGPARPLHGPRPFNRHRRGP